MNSLYDTDYGLWLASQIDSIRSQRWEDLDIDNLIEELEGLNRSNKRELYSYLVVILTHLLKWEFQPQARSGSWEASIINGRNRIQRLFKEQPSLKPYAIEIVQEAHKEAVVLASKETTLSFDTFPVGCLYSANQILEPDFLPQ